LGSPEGDPLMRGLGNVDASLVGAKQAKQAVEEGIDGTELFWTNKQLSLCSKDVSQCPAWTSSQRNQDLGTRFDF